MSQLFITLPGCYDAVVSAMQNLSNDDLKISTIKPRLVAEKLKFKHRSAESITENVEIAFATKKKFKQRINGECNNCGKHGHKKVDCHVKFNSGVNCIWSELCSRLRS